MAISLSLAPDAPTIARSTSVKQPSLWSVNSHHFTPPPHIFVKFPGVRKQMGWIGSSGHPLGRVLQRCFAYLDFSSRLQHIDSVCRLWRAVSLQPSLRSQIDLTFACEVARDHVLSKLFISGGSVVKELLLSGCNWVTDAGLRTVAVCCPSLRSLDLTRSLRVTDKGVAVLGAKCDSLERLVLSGTRLSDVALEAFTRRRVDCSLRVVELQGCRRMTGAPLADASALEELNLTECNRSTETVLYGIFCNCAELRVLRLAECDWVTDWTLESIGPCVPSLRELVVDECNITNAGLEALATVRNLERFSACQVPHLRSRAFRQIASQVTTLKELYLRCCLGLDDALVLALATSCSSLEVLDIGANPNIGSASLFAIVGTRVHGRSTCAFTLRQLRMDCSAVSVEAVVAAIGLLPRLQLLDVRDVVGEVDSFAGFTKVEETVKERLAECNRSTLTAECTSDEAEHLWSTRWVNRQLELNPPPSRTAPRRPVCAILVECDGEYLRDKAKRTQERVEARIEASRRAVMESQRRLNAAVSAGLLAERG